jgi:hypothetical protein
VQGLRAQVPTAADSRRRRAIPPAQALLSDLWRWRRRGGGQRLDEGELPHMVGGAVRGAGGLPLLLRLLMMNTGGVCVRGREK